MSSVFVGVGLFGGMFTQLIKGEKKARCSSVSCFTCINHFIMSIMSYQV